MINPIYTLKIREDYYIAVRSGAKKAEVRKDDRSFRRGDVIRFEVLDHSYNHKQFSTEYYEITHILRHEDFPRGIKPGYSILSIKRLGEKRSWLKGVFGV